MSLRHPSAERWEAQLRAVLARIDRELEAEYRGRFPLHPARPAHGATANPESDGLFSMGAAFTAGFGSEAGPGYIVEIRLATLTSVPAAVRARIEERAIARLREELPRAFPEAGLTVIRDGPVWKIVGDLRLGRA